MAYRRRSLGMGDASDTTYARELHQKALAIVAARKAGDQHALAAAQDAFNSTAATNDQRVAALRDAESATPGLLDQIQSALSGAGKAAGIGLAIVALFTFGPTLLQLAARRRNPGRRRRRRGRR